MKKEIYIFGLFLAFLLCCSWTKAQNISEEPFYYYKGEKIVLEIDYSRIFIVSEDEYTIGDELSVAGIDFVVENCSSIDMNRYSISDTIYNIDFVELLPHSELFFINIIAPEAISHAIYFEALQTLQKNVHIVKASPSYFYLGKRVGISNNFYVKLHSKKDFQMLYDWAMQHSIQILGNNKFMPLWFTLSCGKETPFSALEGANMFHELQLFEYSTPELLYYDLLFSNDEYFPNQWGLKNTGQHCGTSGIDIQAENTWSITTGSSNVKIAIYDRGIDTQHLDLKNNIFSTGYNAQTGTTPSFLFGDHGTMCSGIASAQQNNLIGISGVAPTSKLIPISLAFWMLTTPEQIANGFNWAWQNEVDVISCSWGGYAPDPLIDEAITSTLTYGRNGKGTIIVFAAGNARSINNYNTDVAYPGNSNPDIIVVGGIAPNGERKSLTSCDGEDNWGACYGAELDVVAPCVFIPTTTNESEYIQNFNGTSSACPHVAGVAALVLSVNPNLTVQEVQKIINSTAQKVRTDLYNYETVQGYPYGAWHEEMGYGLVDAYAAVLAAKCYTNLPIVHGYITQNTTWNSDVYAVGTIVIPSGVTLTITSQVVCGTYTSFIIHHGGKLIIDGGTLTNACEGAMWQGIVAEGCALPAPIPLNSFVELKNGATIENAVCGIRAVNGGKIEADSANFINNYAAVQIDIYSEGVFTNSQFILNDNYIEYIGAARRPAQLIVNGSFTPVVVSGCTFSQETALRYIAIRAFNSSLTIDAQTAFSGFWYGIDASNSGVLPKILVEDCEFINNEYGIRLDAMSFPEIIDNDFNLTFSGAQGLDIYESTKYEIERNRFASSVQSLSTKGIVIANSGQDENQIYNNNFYDLEVGIQALYRNSSQGWISEPPVHTGLQFLCNYFDNTQETDILVGDPPNIPYIAHSVRPNQGDSQRPAGNIFIGQCRPNISNYSNYPIYYYFSQYEPDEPPCNTVGIVNKEELDIHSDCPPMGGKLTFSLSQYDEWNKEYEYWLAQLLAAGFNSEEYHLLLNKVSYYSAMKDRYFNSIIIAVMNGKMTIFKELGYYENLRYLFSYRNHYTDNLNTIEAYLAEKNHEEALSALAKMHKLLELTEEDVMELRGLEAYIKWLQQLEKEQNNIYELSEKELDYLISYVKTNNGRGTVFAKNILCVLYEICIEDEKQKSTAPQNQIEEKSDTSISYLQINNKEILDKVSVIPNPTTGELRIMSGELRIDKIEIFDVYGRKLPSNHLKEQGEGKIQLNISHLPAGIYFVKIRTEAGEVVRKVLKE